DRLVILRDDRPELVATLQPVLDRSAARLTPGDDGAAMPVAGGPGTTGPPSFAALRQDGDQPLAPTIPLRLAGVSAPPGRPRRARLLEDAGGADGEAPVFARYRDPMLAAAGGLISTMAVLAAGAFWIATGWPSGAEAVIFAGVICTILASLDDPAAAATSFLR